MNLLKTLLHRTTLLLRQKHYTVCGQSILFLTKNLASRTLETEKRRAARAAPYNQSSRLETS